MEDYVNPAKDIDIDDYWTSVKRPKDRASLQQAFPLAEWDVLTTTIDSQINNEDKQHPARWLAKLSSHYFGEEPVIQSTHNFLRLLKQHPGMSIQQWHTLVRLQYQKCNFPSAVDDRLQWDIFVTGLNDTFKPFRSDLISRENLTTLTLAQVISKVRDFEASLKTESPITRQQLEESVHQVTPGEDTAYKVTPDAVKSKILGIPPNHKAPLPASGAAIHHMHLVMIVLQPMTPVTAVATRATGNKFGEHPLPTQWLKPLTMILKPAPLMSQLMM